MTASPEWTPEDLAMLDQSMAATSMQLGQLVTGLQTQSAAVGRNQAFADMALALTLIPDSAVRGLLLAALNQLTPERGT